MKRLLLTLPLVAFTTFGADQDAAPARGESPSPAILRWRNSEALPGELVAASADDVTWKSPLFQEPLVIRWDALRRIDRELKPAGGTEPFSFRMRDGSHLLGDLTAVTDTTVSIRSARHGDALIKRDQLLGARRIRGADLLFAGPVGDVGWGQAPEAAENRTRHRHEGSLMKRTVPFLRTGPGGALLMPYWNSRADLDIELPERVDIEFRISSTERPDFHVLILGTSKDLPRIATWENDLVIAAGDEFKLIRRLGDNEREVSLRFCWDREKRVAKVFTPAGELLTEWQVPQSVSAKPTDRPVKGNAKTEVARRAALAAAAAKAGAAPEKLAIENKGRDLSLEFLRLKKWDGHSPPATSLAHPAIETADGRRIEGSVISVTAGMLKLRQPGDIGEIEMPLTEVSALVFASESPQLSEEAARLSFADGTLLTGELVSLSDGVAALKTAFTEEPFKSSIHDVRQWLVKPTPDANPPAYPPLAELDKLVVQQTTLHGKLASVGGAGPAWLPVGAVKAVMPGAMLPVEIRRTLPADAKPEITPALFYTSAGDILPGTLRALDHSGIALESALIEHRTLPAGSLEAIQFGGDVVSNIQGFSDPGWRVLKGDDKSVRVEGDSLRMEPGTSFGHPSAMQSGEIKFNFPGAGWVVTRLRLFCAGTDASSTSSNLIIAQTGGRLMVGMEGPEGQLNRQSQTRVQDGSAVVRLVIDEKQVEVHVQGALARRLPIPPSQRAGAGLIIEPATIWGNPEQEISLGSFSATGVPGRIWLPEVAAETKAHALTVPRFRKEDPPGHALLAANGDVLRGEVEAISATHFGFRSGLENLHVPRDRVKALIWLKKPGGEAAPVPADDKVARRLEQTIDNHSSYSGAGLASVISVLQQRAGDLQFELPAKQIERTVHIQFGGQTVGDALEEICKLFDLRYRVDAKGTIVLEQVVGTAPDLIQKAYWLDTDRFAAAPAHEVLAAMGIPFTEGAVAKWEPRGKLLSVLSTPETHQKVLQVLAKEFGGVIGSPTHWLLLTSGARMAMAVENFGEETVIGTHPIYGRCTVPLEQVHLITTIIPPPTPAMRSLAGWRLTFAPEPVLPTTGGESSPMLGKPAAMFKLPLLAGGDFDLAAEKGKVVVLDFWATWCGPCIKSLPDVMKAMEPFSRDQVKLIGVNQSEPPEQVKQFVETRKWDLAVALDAGQAVARQYGVDGIPHTVIVGPDGNVAWVKSGYTPDGAAELAAAVNALLNPPSKISGPAEDS